MILIVSPSKDFSEVVAGGVRRALGLECMICETLPNILDKNIKIIVSDREMECAATLVVPDVIPFRFNMLLDKISHALRGIAQADEVTLCNNYILSNRSKTLRHGFSGRAVSLTDKEIQLLKALHLAGREGMEKNRLLNEIWGIAADVNTHTLETHLYRLRTKLRELSGAENAIDANAGKYTLNL
ncbi:MAG: hypothetical protein GC188_10200 [Alphaproteobacteria bacterium]|nr:hypothetical protein [Alphaproteobacteria bacterium]